MSEERLIARQITPLLCGAWGVANRLCCGVESQRMLRTVNMTLLATFSSRQSPCMDEGAVIPIGSGRPATVLNRGAGCKSRYYEGMGWPWRLGGTREGRTGEGGASEVHSVAREEEHCGERQLDRASRDDATGWPRP